MKLGGEIVREPALELLLMHLPTQPSHLPGYLAVLSVLVVGWDVGDDFDPNRVIN
jgi:hypothetical protein